MAWQNQVVCVACWRRLNLEGGHRDQNLSGTAIHTKIAGTSFDDHQDNIDLVDEGETLKLVREPDNAYDSNAIAIQTSDGCPLGHINKDLAADLAPAMDAGQYFKCTVTALTGGTDEKPTKGVNILIEQTATPPTVPGTPSGCRGCMGCLLIFILLNLIGVLILESAHF